MSENGKDKPGESDKDKEKIKKIADKGKTGKVKEAFEKKYGKGDNNKKG